MPQTEIVAVSPFFIVNDVPTALAFYRDRLGFEITFEGPSKTPEPPLRAANPCLRY